MTTAKPRPLLAPGEIRTYPVLPLRDIVVFPHMIVPLFLGRKKSILALEEAMRSDTFILLATQKNASDDGEYGHRCDQQNGEDDRPYQRRKMHVVMVCHGVCSRRQLLANAAISASRVGS